MKKGYKVFLGIIVGLLLLISLGVNFYTLYFKDKSCKCVRNNCDKQECNYSQNIESEEVILELMSKSNLAKGFANNGGLKLVKNINNKNELKGKNNLRKFSDEYIVPLILQRMEFKYPHNSWENNEGVLALSIAYINSNYESFFDSDKVYKKDVIEETIKYLFNTKISLDASYSLSHSLNHSEYYYIGDYYYFSSSIGAKEGNCLEYDSIKENGNTIEYIYKACNTNDTELEHFAPGSNVHITYEKSNNNYFIKSIIDNTK